MMPLFAFPLTEMHEMDFTFPVPIVLYGIPSSPSALLRAGRGTDQKPKVEVRQDRGKIPVSGQIDEQSLPGQVCQSTQVPDQTSGGTGQRTLPKRVGRVPVCRQAGAKRPFGHPKRGPPKTVFPTVATQF